MTENHAMSAREQLNDLREKMMQDVIDIVLTQEVAPNWPQWLYGIAKKKTEQSRNDSRLKQDAVKYRGYVQNVDRHIGGKKAASKKNVDVTFGYFILSRCSDTKDYFRFIPAEYAEVLRTSRNDDDHDTFRDQKFHNNAVVFTELKDLEELAENLPGVFPEKYRRKIQAVQKNWMARLQNANRKAVQEAAEGTEGQEESRDAQHHFREVIEMEDYKSFAAHVLRNYYGRDFFSEINGRLFPVFILKGRPLQARRSILDFDCLSNFKDSELTDFNVKDHQDYVHDPWYEEYHEILKGTIHYPDRPGYMLKNMNLNEKGEITDFSARVGTYAENVYGTHVLEYEMYRIYEEFGKQNIDDPAIWKKLKGKMTVRNGFHPGSGDPSDPDFHEKMLNSLLHMNRNIHSLLSVQMLVAVKSALTGKHELKIVQRSSRVAIAPDVYQMIPAGGFEILNDSDDDQYDDIELESNFSAGCAVFREYLEELFNMPEFEGNGTGSIEERLLKDEHIVEINQMIRNGTAHLQFLGSALDLGGLRHELSFALVIDDEEYSTRKFIPNEECKKGRIIERMDIGSFEQKTSVWKHIHGPSAAMWKLFRDTDLYRSTLRQDEEEHNES